MDDGQSIYIEFMEFILKITIFLLYYAIKLTF